MHEPLIGIDLGTTNSALAWSAGRGPIRILDIIQLVAPGDATARPTLPSFLYLTDAAARETGAARLPWNPTPEVIAGVLAREEGALVPARQISSAKSWLSNLHVDRTAALLPWGTDAGPKLSPVQASAAVLAHIRDAWNHVHAADDPSLRLERQQIVLTVPASFDEEARELTVQAARDAGLASVTLLEEPLAALYAWIAAHRRDLAATFGAGGLILVCDVGGGTTDFSLIRARMDETDGELAFERVAIGEHLLLGGDNFDLALAVLVAQKLGNAAKLTVVQRETLRRKCSAAKEQLLTPGAPDRVPITILGAGRGVVGGQLSTDLTREDVVRTLTEGFLPVTAAGEWPSRDRRLGLRELGLPYESDPAITKHLAAFLSRAADGSSLARPDTVLFNGGFFTPAIARESMLDALQYWFGRRPVVLENEKPEAAVAVGAAFYARLRRDPDSAKRLIIRAGSAHSYYIGVEAASETAASQGRIAAISVMPRGTDEGTSIQLARTFTVITNRPAAFTLYSSSERSDPAGALVTFDEDENLVRHAPLVTAFRYGKRSRQVPLQVRLAIAFTETGTLELWCESTTTEHRWRLAFNLRSAEADPLDSVDTAADTDGRPAVVISDDALARGVQRTREVFGSEAASLGPAGLVGELETTLGHGKQAWPLATIRRMADVLLEVAAGRNRSAAHETRWLNLTGFCMRPGLGSAKDAFRVAELRKVYMAGLRFPREVQNQVEWLVLWQRVAAGFTTGQQRELAQRVAGTRGLGGRKPTRLNAQIERESWRLLASLERLDAGQRVRFGEELLDRIRRDPRNASWLWSIARLGARTPLYGPLNVVVPPPIAEQWLDRLLALKILTIEAAAAIAEIGARTDDAARDVSVEVRLAAAERLEGAGFSAELLRQAVPPQRRDVERMFGEALPEGLRLEAS